MNKYLYIAISIVLCAALTFFTRLVPFAIFSKIKMPPLVQKLAKLMPSAVIAVLVVYCVRDAFYADLTTMLITFGAVAVTAALHVWKGQTLLSIAGGTVVYMAALRLFT